MISRKAILRYKLLFRFLLHLEYVEQKATFWREFDKWRLRVFRSFVQQILAFATFEVLEPIWRALEVTLAQDSDTNDEGYHPTTSWGVYSFRFARFVPSTDYNY